MKAKICQPYGWIWVILPIMFLNAALISCSSSGKVSRMEQWRMAEITLTSSMSYTNPFMNVDVTATFTGPGGEVINRPGFWDGGDTWKVRFAPTRLGRWRYTVNSSDPENTGLNNQSGTLQSVAYKGDLAIYQHGFLKVSDDHRYLVYADNTPFFYLGDTHWFMPHENWDTCNKPGCTSQFRYMVDKRVAQKFTVYQSEPQTNNPAWNKGVTEVYPERFIDIDRKFQYIADQGLVHANALGCHSQAVDLTGPGAARLARYWAARYGAYPVVWFTAQEFDLNNQAYEPTWKEAARAFAENDSYRHPITGHYYTTANGQSVTYWGDEPWHSYFMLQNGHGRQNRIVFYKNYWDLVPPKPFLESEANYDDILNHAVNTEDVRVSAYIAIQSGSFGFGYGANGIWNDIYDTGDEGCCVTDYGFTSWKDAIDFESGDQMTMLYNFYTTLDWWKLEPRFTDQSWAKFANPERSVLKSENNQVYVVYFSNTTIKTGTLKQMNNQATYTTKWYNPRSGEYIAISGSVNASGGEWEIPTKPDEQDWLLLVTDNGRN